MSKLYVPQHIPVPLSQGSTPACLAALLAPFSSHSHQMHCGAAGLCWLRFNSTATPQLSRFLPWHLSETAGSSFQKPPGTATHSKEVFLPSTSCSQPEQNKPQGKLRDMSTSADRFHRNSSWDGWDSAASEGGSPEQESFGT